MLGRHHPLLRRLRSLRRDRRLRDEQSLFVAEGLHLAGEALTHGAQIERAVVSPALERSEEGRGLLRRLRDAAVPLERTSDDVLQGLQDARAPQPILLVVRRRELPPPRPGSAPALLVVLCGVQDPGNLGSLIRSADGAGASAFVVCGESVDAYHPRTVRASMGSIFRLTPRTTTLDTVLDELRGSPLTLIATDPHLGQAYERVDLTRPCAIFFGAEGRGLPQGLGRTLDETLHIPMHPGVESLSVVAAGAAILFETARQRRVSSRGPCGG